MNKTADDEIITLYRKYGTDLNTHIIPRTTINTGTLHNYINNNLNFISQQTVSADWLR